MWILRQLSVESRDTGDLEWEEDMKGVLDGEGIWLQGDLLECASWSEGVKDRRWLSEIRCLKQVSEVLKLSPMTRFSIGPWSVR